jgi:hypothetical protein
MSVSVQWVVFAELSTDAMIATGITGKPSAARWIVESVMAEVRNAGWGEALRVPLSVAGEAGTAWLGLRWRQWAGPRAGHDWIGACLEDVAAVGVVAAAAWQAG